MEKRELNENEKKFIRDFSAFVNGKMSYYGGEEVGRTMACDHRYLVQEKFKIALGFVATLGEYYLMGYYDGRNEWACRCAYEMIKGAMNGEQFFPNGDLFPKLREEFENLK